MLENIIKSSKYVMDNAKYVKIDYNKLDDFIQNIDCKNLKFWLSNNPYNIFELGIDNIVNFLLYFEAIDYSFWGNPKWTIETNLGFKDGSDALLYSLLNYFKENKYIDFLSINLEDFKHILKGNIEIPLIEERYNTLVEISSIVNNKMNGNFYVAIKNIKKDTELLEFIISNFPSFKDERKYKGKTIYFYKLAQLLVSDILHLRELLERIEVDYSNLVGCADYKIPQTLRALEIIKYSPELERVIDNKKEIKISSEYEVEVRASTLVVIDYIKNKLKDVSAIDINDYLFIFSKKVKTKAKPYHLCRNTNY